MNSVQIIDLFATSRTGIDVASDQIIESVRSGEVNPLKVRVWVKTVEEILKRVNSETQDAQLREADKYVGNRLEYAGAIVERAELGTKYDFSVCGDTVWERLSVDAQTANSALKEREAFLKTITAPIKVVDDLTGEIVQVSPPSKQSTSGLKVIIR